VQNPRLAARYAKSLLDLAVEQNALDATAEDMRTLDNLVRSSSEFAAVLRSPVIKGDKKSAIINAVAGNSISALSKAFLNLLVTKGRESVMPEIASAFLQQYRERQGIHSVKLTTATPADDRMKEAIRAKVSAMLPQGATIELTTKVDPSLIGGFLLEMDNQLVDASIRRDLRDIKKQFTQNLYVQNIR